MGLQSRRLALALAVMLAVWAMGGGSSGAQGAPSITSAPPLNGVVGMGYVHQFTSSVQMPAPTFSVTSGMLPPGLTLSPAGFVTGVPSPAGTYGPTTVCASTTPPACQTFTITIARRSPAILASASPGGPVGTPVRDMAGIVNGFTPTGTVTFRLFSDAACTNEVFSSTNPLQADGTAVSGDFVPTAPGTYRWTATYNGDVNNNPVTSACGTGNEVVITGMGTTTTTTSTTTTLPTTTTSLSTTSTTATSTSTTSSTSSTSTSSTTSTSTTSTTSTTLPPTGTTTSSTTSSLPGTTSTTSSTTTTVPTSTSTTTASTSTSTSTSTSVPATTTTTVPGVTTTIVGVTTTPTFFVVATTAPPFTGTPFVVTPAAAAPSGPSIQASSQQVVPGETITLSGSGFPPGSALQAEMFTEPVLLGTTTADAFGNFVMRVTIPLDTVPGGHTIRVSVIGGGPRAELTIFVLAPQRVQQAQQVIVAAGTAATLSRTGGEMTRTARAAFALVVLGFAMVGLAWKDSRRAVPALGRRQRWPARTRRWR